MEERECDNCKYELWEWDSAPCGTCFTGENWSSKSDDEDPEETLP